MEDKYEAAFEEVVFAVTKLLFNDATSGICQRIVTLVLIQLGVRDVIEQLRSKE
jgi:hypothetical protein